MCLTVGFTESNCFTAKSTVQLLHVLNEVVGSATSMTVTMPTFHLGQNKMWGELTTSLDIITLPVSPKLGAQ